MHLSWPGAQHTGDTRPHRTVTNVSLPGLAPLVTQACEQAGAESRGTCRPAYSQVTADAGPYKEPGTRSPASPFLMAGSCLRQALQGAISSDH